LINNTVNVNLDSRHPVYITVWSLMEVVINKTLLLPGTSILGALVAWAPNILLGAHPLVTPPQ